MSVVNEVRLTGRLTKDAEIKYLNSGTPIVTFSLAITRNVKEGDGYKEVVDYFETTMFGKRAESLVKHLKKGIKVSILGELRQDSWVDQSGNKKYKTSIITFDIDINFPPKQNGQQQNQNTQNYNQNNQQNYQQQTPATNQNNYNQDDYEDKIPF